MNIPFQAENTRPQTKPQTNMLVHEVLAAISMLLALFAVFGMANWAEMSPLHHALQHVILFMGGVGVGTSLLKSMKRGK